ncbi:MAG TPA: MBL fold metallo-hydrolase [Armatimonadota bacterium]|jgi:glyoxylase-like metal-dependent hydrolase (beta-lactamase superfamily II)
MRIADGIEMLEIAAMVMGKPTVIYPTLLWDEKTAVLVDTGYPGQQAAVRETIEQAGIPFARLRVIILTHQDLDHIGSLPALLQEAPQQVQVLASATAQPYIQGERPSLRFTPAVIERMMASLPTEYTAERRQAFRYALEHPPTARVDQTVTDGEVLPYGGGITVITTPGHIPGHLCLYHAPSKTLIAGDALMMVDGQLQRPAPHVDLNREEASRSLTKLLAYDITTVICYHGGRYTDGIHQRIAELVR